MINTGNIVYTIYSLHGSEEVNKDNMYYNLIHEQFSLKNLSVLPQGTAYGHMQASQLYCVCRRLAVFQILYFNSQAFLWLQRIPTALAPLLCVFHGSIIGHDRRTAYFKTRRRIGRVFRYLQLFSPHLYVLKLYNIQEFHRIRSLSRRFLHSSVCQWVFWKLCFTCICVDNHTSTYTQFQLKSAN